MDLFTGNFDTVESLSQNSESLGTVTRGKGVAGCYVVCV